MPSKPDAAVGMLWYQSSVTVPNYSAVISPSPFRILDVFYIIAYRYHYLIRYKPFPYKIHGERIRHLPDNYSGFFSVVWFMQHLSGTKAVVCRPVLFNIHNGTRFPAPGMIYQQLGVFTKQLIQDVLIIN